MKDFRKFQSQPDKPDQLIFEEERNRIKRIFEGDMKELNRYCKEVGRELADNKVSNSQLRNILDEVQDIFRSKPGDKQEEFEAKIQNKLELLRPKLAYLVGKQKNREQKNALRKLNVILNSAINMLAQENFETFKYFMEAIVAYHRFHEGEKK